VGGEARFHYPRAEQGDAHGEFDLGRMYYEGGLLPPERDRGLALIRSAAGKGYEHAVRFLRRLEQGDGPADGKTA
jgi:TPR repeat protein